MKHITLFLILLIAMGSTGQASNQTEFAYDDFEKQILSYKPEHQSSVSKKDFDYGQMIINETKSRIKNNLENFDLADYFNVLSAFLTLKESESNINIAFEKFKDADGSCKYFLSLESTISKYAKYDIIREEYNKYLSKCKSNPKIEIEFDITEYCKSNNLNLDLVKIIRNIDESDQKYRSKKQNNWAEKQDPIDMQNQIIIDSLYIIHKTYIGKALVGEKFESIMWTIIQHSNLEMMEKYLPIIQKAVEDEELNVTPFKMLLDRYYGLKYGYQFFGTQSGFGFDLADDKTRNEIIKKYGIE